MKFADRSDSRFPRRPRNCAATLRFAWIALAACLYSPGSPRAECIDYAEHLRLAASLRLPDEARGVAFGGGYAFVADGDSGLQVVDISSPANPTLAATVATPAEARGVVTAGSLAFVADGSAG